MTCYSSRKTSTDYLLISSPFRPNSVYDYFSDVTFIEHGFVRNVAKIFANVLKLPRGKIGRAKCVCDMCDARRLFPEKPCYVNPVSASKQPK